MNKIDRYVLDCSCGSKCMILRLPLVDVTGELARLIGEFPFKLEKSYGLEAGESARAGML